MDTIDYDGTCDWPDFHSVVTIQLCELIDAGFCDETLTGWEWPKYSDEQDARLRKKIVDHYLYREISLVPPGLWKHEFIRKMNEIMPKYVPMYKLLNEQPELFGGSSDYYKSRNVYSDFPQTQLSGSNGDYASSGNDMESQRIRQADVLDIAKRLDSYNDVDLMIIEDMQTMFSSLMTVNINAF